MTLVRSSVYGDKDPHWEVAFKNFKLSGSEEIAPCFRLTWDKKKTIKTKGVEGVRDKRPGNAVKDI